MKEIRIDADLHYSQKLSDTEGQTFVEGLLVIGGTINVRYDLFSGGSNGTGLFTFNCTVRQDTDDRIFQQQIW